MTLSAAITWEVQTGGNDSNGGGFKTGATGTSRSYPTSSAQSITDLKTDTTNLNKMASATYTFVATDVGNVINVTTTDAGSHAIVGRYEITAVAAGIATVDRNWSAADNSDHADAVAILGGAFATPAAAVTAATVSGHKVYIKSGTYNLTTTTAGNPGGPVLVGSSISVDVEGYETTRGDLGAKPVLNANDQTGTYYLFNGNASGVVNWINLKADGNHLASVSGFVPAGLYNTFYLCEAVNCDQSGCYGINFGNARAFCCKVSACTTGFYTTGAPCALYGCLSIDNVTGFNIGTIASAIVNCVAHGNSGDGFFANAEHGNIFVNCTADANGSDGFSIGTRVVAFINCVSTDNGAYGYQIATNNPFINNASGVGSDSGDNASGDYDNTPVLLRLFKDITVNPYISGTDFRPNNTTGGGALLRALGAITPDQTGYPDIGAIPHTPDYPSVGNVLSSDTVNDVAGTLTLPAEANVWKGSGAYGVGGTGSTPSKIATSIPTDSGTLEAADIKNAVVVDPGADQIVGTASGGGGTYTFIGG